MSCSENSQKPRTFNEGPKITPKDVTTVKRDKIYDWRKKAMERRGENNNRG